MKDFKVVGEKDHAVIPVRIEVRGSGSYALSDGDYIFDSYPDEITRLVTVDTYYEGIEQEFIRPEEIQALRYLPF